MMCVDSEPATHDDDDGDDDDKSLRNDNNNNNNHYNDLLSLVSLSDSFVFSLHTLFAQVWGEKINVGMAGMPAKNNDNCYLILYTYFKMDMRRY